MYIIYNYIGIIEEDTILNIYIFYRIFEVKMKIRLKYTLKYTYIQYLIFLAANVFNDRDTRLNTFFISNININI